MLDYILNLQTFYLVIDLFKKNINKFSAHLRSKKT